MPSRQTYINNLKVGNLACWIGGHRWGGGGAEKRGDTFSKNKKDHLKWISIQLGTGLGI